MVDSHVHLWDPCHLPYSWLKDVPAINRAFLLPDYAAQTSGSDVDSIVFVECTGSMDNIQSKEEVEWVEELAAGDNRIQGIVAHVSLEDGESAIDYLNWLADRPLVKGVRRLLQGESDPLFSLQAPFIDNIQRLESLKLSFDICIVHHQMPAVIEMVKRCPSVEFILDHGGKPDLKQSQIATWKEHLEQLASHSNVSCKLSGLITEAHHASWTGEDVMPAMRHVLACFGSNRVLFGGDWPVVLLAGKWQRWQEMVSSFLADLPLSHQKAIMGENARRIYRL